MPVTPPPPPLLTRIHATIDETLTEAIDQVAASYRAQIARASGASAVRTRMRMKLRVNLYIQKRLLRNSSRVCAALLPPPPPPEQPRTKVCLDLFPSSISAALRAVTVHHMHMPGLQCPPPLDNIPGLQCTCLDCSAPLWTPTTSAKGCLQKPPHAMHAFATTPNGGLRTQQYLYKHDLPSCCCGLRVLCETIRSVTAAREQREQAARLTEGTASP